MQQQKSPQVPQCRAAFVFVVSLITMMVISKLMGGILEESEKVPGISKGATRKHATSGGR